MAQQCGTQSETAKSFLQSLAVDASPRLPIIQWPLKLKLEGIQISRCGKLIGQMVDISEIVKLRLVVGFLGERENAAWWPSMWLTSNASAFLTPVYGNRLSPARYHGVVEAARRVHDERIGIGQAFHLFRLPEGLERRLHEAVLEERACTSLGDIAARDAAQNALSALSQETQNTNPGPVRIGSPHDLRGRKWIPALAAQYRAAFASSIQTFPYFAERQ